MLEIDHHRLVSLVRTAVAEVFSTMLGLTVTPLDAYEDTASPSGPTAGVLALLGFAGAYAGTGSFSCSAPMACKISGALLMSEYDAVNEEVLDAIAEVTNMILGNVKSSLEEELGPMGLSLPTVIFGRNFVTRSLGRYTWSIVPFELEGEAIELQICLAPNQDGHESIRAGAARPFGVHM
jgi:chemotaxis protein CheX